MRNDAEVLMVKWGVPLGLALLAVGARYMFSPGRPTFLRMLRGIFVGLFVGALVNLYLSGFDDMSPPSRGAAVGVSAMIAEDLVLALLAIGKRLRENPAKFLSIFFGRK